MSRFNIVLAMAALVLLTAGGSSRLAATVAAQNTTLLLVPSAPRDLGTLGGTMSEVTHISESGVVVGISLIAGNVQTHAFAWTEASGMVELTLGGESFPVAVNDSGMVVGRSRLAGGGLWHGFVWTPAGGIRDIGHLGGVQTWPTAVNQAGVVVGRSFGAHGDRAFVWSETGGMQDLGTLGGSQSSAEAISDTGIVAGWSGSLSGISAFVWTDADGMVEITAPGGSSRAMAVNDSGVVVGSARFNASDTSERPFAWTAAGGMMDIAPSFISGYANRVSPDGTVVGLASTGVETKAFGWTAVGGFVELSFGGFSTIGELSRSGIAVGWGLAPLLLKSRAFTWSPGSGFVNLGAPSASLSTAAVAINSFGIVAGVDTPDFGAAQPFVWTPELGRVTLPTAGGHSSPRVISDGGIVGGTTHVSGFFDRRATIWTLTWSTATNVVITPVGPDVTVEPTATLPDGSTASVSLDFDSVVTGGTTTVETSSGGPPPPDGFKLGQPPIYYDVETTAVFSGAVTLCFTWQEGQIRNESTARLFHFENDAWRDVTTSVDTTANRICGSVTGLSPFMIGEMSYTFGGFDLPLREDGSASIQQTVGGRTIPVRFSLTRLGEPVPDATATLAAYKLLDAASGTVDTTDLTGDAGAANDTGNLFRHVGTGRYLFNLSTQGWPAPATYQLIVTLNDGSQHSVTFSLRR